MTSRLFCRLGALVTVVSLVLGGGLLMSAGPASAERGFTISGRGYGHGHGLSQYGAEGAARDGLGWQEIVGFYYPGTELGQTQGDLKVWLSEIPDGPLIVKSRKRLVLTDLSHGKRWKVPHQRGRIWRLKESRRGRTVLDRRDGGRWVRTRAFDGLGELSAGGRKIKVDNGGGWSSYRGALRAVRESPEDLDVVNVVPMETYLRGVVPREMPASWSPAALQAQAVAARSYAAYLRDHPSRAHYDMCDTTACQVYGGADDEHPASDAAIRATRGRVVLSGGKAAFTQFSSSNGGWTAAGGMSYLGAKKDPYDGWSGNPVHNWQVRVSARTLQSHWPSVGRVQSIEVTDRDGNGRWGGRVSALRLTGTDGTVSLSGDDVRIALGLRSNWFSVN